jgi:hypothetical protein
MKKPMYLMLFVLMAGMVGCGPNKTIVRLKRQVAQLQAEKQREVSRLQKEKFEAMQVRRVALERQQKLCRSELKHLRHQHRKLSFKVSDMAQKIQGYLNKIVSETLLMPHHEQTKPNEPPASPAPSTPPQDDAKQPDAKQPPQTRQPAPTKPKAK